MQANGYCHFNDKKVNRQFHISLFGHELSIQQMPDDRLLGHGAVVWDSAAIFVKYMECNPKDYDSSKLAGKTVLELGSGCGLAGIAFMMRGAVVTCTDLSDVTIALTMKNVNNVYVQLKTSGEVQGDTVLYRPAVMPLDWTDNPISVQRKTMGLSTDELSVVQKMKLAQSITTAVTAAAYATDKSSVRPSPGIGSEAVNETTDIQPMESSDGFTSLIRAAPYDIILLTDCVFALELVEHLVNSILCFCGPRTTVYCCHEIRDEVVNTAFLLEMGRSFTIKRVPPSKLHRDFNNDMVQVIQCRLTRKLLTEA